MTNILWMRSPQGLSTEARLAKRRQPPAGVGRTSSTPSAGPCGHPVKREGCFVGVLVGLPRSSPGEKDLLASSLLGKWPWGAPPGEQGREKGNECVNELSPTAGPPGGSIEHVTGSVHPPSCPFMTGKLKCREARSHNQESKPSQEHRPGP